ncbi:ABC transporter permease [Clostridium gasigenes]|uniref:ABC transporter permease n=1 Tax=Clostridium gasigenes TaxID=94869 RepID=UPI0014382AE9|nr:ABC transporter permease [Clostridium gasigenes]NKF06700.1 ABC transporter permease [Clostridium gasigenes]QSW20952.1 ABC transporter permease [Clostridium gasigenes]
MKFLYMVLVNCKKYFKDYVSIGCMFILPIAVVIFVNFISGPGPSSKSLNLKVAMVNLDTGDLGKELVEKINPPSVYDNKEEALEGLKNYNVIAIYEIPENFTNQINDNKKPTINSYKLEAGNSVQIFEVQIEEKVNELFKVQILKNSNIINNENEVNKNIINIQYDMEKNIMGGTEFMPIVMIMFFLVSFSSNISTDLLKLRQGKILERFLSTANKGYEIIGSIYISMVITQTIMYTASFIVMKLILKIKFVNFEFLVLNIALMSMISISLAIMVNRIFKIPGVASLVLNLISIIMFFLYMAGLIGETSSNILQIIITLSKFTPFYWALGSIEKAVLFPNIFILILIALTFYSAGSIRYSNFAKE